MLAKLVWRLVGGVAAAAAGRLARVAASAAWRGVRGQEPPAGATEPGAPVADAALWAGVSAAAVALSKALAAREVNRRATGAAGPARPRRR
ncbi:MAG: DUF4235 domain-containing protein [Mycobacteriales bacterium]